MNKLLLSLATIVHFSCSKSSNDSQPPPPPPQLKADSIALTLSGNKNGVDSFNIQYSGNWQISLNPSTITWVKVDANGNKVWERSYGGSSAELGASIARTVDGNFVIAAQSKSSDGDVSINKGGSDLFVFKIDGGGTTLWKKTYGGSLGEYVYSN